MYKHTNLSLPFVTPHRSSRLSHPQLMDTMSLGHKGHERDFICVYTRKETWREGSNFFSFSAFVIWFTRVFDNFCVVTSLMLTRARRNEGSNSLYLERFPCQGCMWLSQRKKFLLILLERFSSFSVPRSISHSLLQQRCLAVLPSLLWSVLNTPLSCSVLFQFKDFHVLIKKLICLSRL